MEVTPTIASEKLYGNKFAFVEFKNPEGAQIVRAPLYDQSLGAALEHRSREGRDRGQLADQLRSLPPQRAQAVVVDSRIDDLIKTIVPRRTNPLAAWARSWSG